MTSYLSAIDRLLSLIESPKIGVIGIYIVFKLNSSRERKLKENDIRETRSSPYKDDYSHSFMHLYHVSLFSFVVTVFSPFFFFFTNLRNCMLFVSFIFFLISVRYVTYAFV